MDWFQYDNGFRRERVKLLNIVAKIYILGIHGSSGYVSKCIRIFCNVQVFSSKDPTLNHHRTICRCPP